MFETFNCTFLNRVISAWFDDNLDDNSSSSLEESSQLDANASVRAGILFFMATTSLIGNLFTIVSIAVTNKKRSSSSSQHTLLIQLGVSDLLVSICYISGEAVWTYAVDWRDGQVLCKIFKFCQVFCLYLSTLTIVLIGLDRLRAIRQPMSHRSCFKPIWIIWILSAVFASPQLWIFRVVEDPFRDPFYQCVTYGFYIQDWQEKSYGIFILLTMFLGPLLILIACYVCIFCTISKKEQGLISTPLPLMDRWPAENIVSLRSRGGYRHHPYLLRSYSLRRYNNFKRAKMKSLRVSVIIVMAFVICWAPYYFMMFTFIFFNPDDKLSQVMQTIFFFGMSNSLVNPLIYGAFHMCQQNRKRRHKIPNFFSAELTECVQGGFFRRGGRPDTINFSNSANERYLTTKTNRLVDHDAHKWMLIHRHHHIFQSNREPQVLTSRL